MRSSASGDSPDSIPASYTSTSKALSASELAINKQVIVCTKPEAKSCTSPTLFLVSAYVSIVTDLRMRICL